EFPQLPGRFEIDNVPVSVIPQAISHAQDFAIDEESIKTFPDGFRNQRKTFYRCLCLNPDPEMLLPTRPHSEGCQMVIPLRSRGSPQEAAGKRVI
ncbi:MAG: hypothetical protein ACK58T_07565, partial [Phycisphaerae bacterium]